MATSACGWSSNNRVKTKSASNKPEIDLLTIIIHWNQPASRSSSFSHASSSGQRSQFGICLNRFNRTVFVNVLASLTQNRLLTSDLLTLLVILPTNYLKLIGIWACWRCLLVISNVRKEGTETPHIRYIWLGWTQSVLAMVYGCWC